MPHDIETMRIVRAACGDPRSIKSIIESRKDDDDDDDRLKHRFAALVVCDREPHPLATITAWAMFESAPSALHVAALSVLPQALDMLKCDAYADIRGPLTAAIAACIAAAPGIDMKSVISAAQFMHLEANAHLAAAVMRHLGTPQGGRNDAVRWSHAPAPMRQALIDAVTTIHFCAAQGGGAAWDELTDEERVRIAFAAANASFAAADLMQGIGWRGWASLPDHARKALLHAVQFDALRAALGGGSVWEALTTEERTLIVSSVMREEGIAAYLIERIGVEQWRAMPAAMHKRLLEAGCDCPISAARWGAVWAALTEDDQERIARLAARDADAAMELIHSIAAEWQDVAPAIRATLLNAACAKSSAACLVRTSGWNAMTDEERAAIAQSAAQQPYEAATLLGGIGHDGWSRLGQAARTALLQAITRTPWQAALGGGKVWLALTRKERATIVRSLISRPDAVAELMIIIGSAGWAQTSERLRAALLHAVCRAPLNAARGGGKVWLALTHDERTKVARTAARHPRAAAELLEQSRAAGAGLTAEHGDALHACASDPYAAAQAILAVGDALDDAWRQRLLRTVFIDHLCDASFAVAQAMHAGATWRNWMLTFAPDLDADADLRNAWTPLARYLPQPRAVGLLVRRNRFRSTS